MQKVCFKICNFAFVVFVFLERLIHGTPRTFMGIETKMEVQHFNPTFVSDQATLYMLSMGVGT